MIPIAESLVQAGEGRFIVTSLELWSGLVVVHWALPGRMSKSRVDDLRDLPWSLRDDVGTKYSSAGASYGGWAQLSAGSAHFTPGCPLETQRLWIGHGSLEREVQIPA